MLERIGVLEDDVRTLRGIVAELANVMLGHDLWHDGSENLGIERCICCDVEFDWDNRQDRPFLMAYWRGDIEFPHADDCPYDAALRIQSAEEARHAGD